MSPTDRKDPEAWPPLIIMVAPTGAHKTKADHPELPVGPDEIARTAAACREAGASIIHLHVRDRDGRHSLDADAYREAMAAVRREVGDGLVIQVTSEAAGRFERDRQMAMVRELRPEAVSLAVREILPDGSPEGPGAEFLAWMEAERIAPQYILYSDEDLRRFHELRRRGIVPGEHPFLLFVLGRYKAGHQSHPEELLPFLAADPGDCPWALCAFGRRENACVLAAAALGGHGRVGFENNLHLSDGRMAPDNAALVAQFRDGAALLGRPVADADAARRMMGARRAVDTQSARRAPRKPTSGAGRPAPLQTPFHEA